MAVGTRTACVVMMAALGATALQAARPQPSPARAQVLQNVVACRSISDKDARLACYDRSVGALDEAEAHNDIVIADQAQVAQAKRSLFGFAVPIVSLFKGGGKSPKARAMQEELEQIETTATAVSRNGQGQLVVTLEDGAVWQQTDDEFVGGHPRAGSPVLIKRAALGSYKLSIDKQIAVRARRIR